MKNTYVLIKKQAKYKKRNIITQSMSFLNCND